MNQSTDYGRSLILVSDYLDAPQRSSKQDCKIKYSPIFD